VLNPFICLFVTLFILSVTGRIGDDTVWFSREFLFSGHSGVAFLFFIPYLLIGLIFAILKNLEKQKNEDKQKEAALKEAALENVRAKNAEIETLKAEIEQLKEKARRGI
jgi:uncharacterized protein YlxW (UPF0749 family)